MFRSLSFVLSMFLVWCVSRGPVEAAQNAENQAEAIELPSPTADAAASSPAWQSGSTELPHYWVEGTDSHGQLKIFPAILETRRYGPIEDPPHEFYALRNGQEPGFPISPPAAGWGCGYYGYGGFGVPSWGFGFVGYNRYFYRPWYSYPYQYSWTNHFPWYSPGGVGPNIYQPWYTTRNALPWYSPYGIGPNIYTPTYQWQMYYPWYAPNGPGPNIYTPWWQYSGCFYW